LADDGRWDDAHAIVQNGGDATAFWIHANLHREEGEDGNAAFWYGRAGRERPDDSCSEERQRIRKELESGPTG